jgi:A/G-specific adenine glycosylase
LTDDPYRIFIAEMMLQQTQVRRVIDKYDKFLQRFPDFESLARASLRSLLTAWSGMGYNRRALYMKKAAEIIVTDYGGRLPEGVEELRALPGIGPASAASIAASAFGIAAPFIETNIRSVFIHSFFEGRDDVTDAEILPLVEATLDRRDPRTWYNALMDYGVSLKRRHGNPSRRSAHHARQSRFAGSDRQVRGLVVRALTRRRMDERELKSETGVPLARLRPILERLRAEGLIVKRGKKYRIG